MNQMDLQREMLIVQAMLARCVEMELEQCVIQAVNIREVFAGVRRSELYCVAVVLDPKFSIIRIFQGDAAFSNVGIDVDRGLVFSHSTGGIGLVESVPKDRASVAGVRPVGRASTALVDTGRRQRGEGCR